MKNQIRALHIHIICNNSQVKEYDILASRKFNIGDETYVIKGNCCYLRKNNNIITEVAYYHEGNPNPYDLRKVEKNKGLNANELDHYIDGDIFNILIECQTMLDRSRHTKTIATIVLIIGIFNFILLRFF